MALLRPLAGLAACAAMLLALAACASGSTDRERIAAIVKQAGSDPASVCDHVGQALLAQVGGRAGCRRQAASAAKDLSTHARSIRVRGTSASAVAVNRAGAHAISLIKQGSTWIVVGVR